MNSLFLLAALLAFSAFTATAGEYEHLEGRKITEIRFTGMRFTPVERVRKQIISTVGAPFTEKNLQRDLDRLDRLAVFSVLEGAPVEDGEGVALEFELSEVSRIFPYPSMEITGESGVAIGGGVKYASPGGIPAHLSTAVQFGGTTNVEVIMERQWLPQDALTYRTRIMWRKRFNDLDHFDENALDPQLRLGHRFTEDFTAGGLFKFFTISSKQEGITNSPDNRDYIYSPGFYVEHDTRNSWFMPTKGWQNSFDLTRSFGDGKFWRTDIDLRRYQPLADRHTLALFSLTTLQTGTVGVGQEVPIYADFHIGGTNSQRGWDIDARHGKNQMLNTLEYRYTLVRPRAFKVWKLRLRAGVQLAAFGDLSSAWDEGDEFSKNFIGGGGVGIRLIMPWVNMIRLDFAWGQPGKSVIPHIGVYEKAYEQRKRVR